MRVGMRVAFGLGISLAIAGIVYGFTADEWRGTVMLLVCAVGFAYVGLELRRSTRGVSTEGTRVTESDEHAEIEPHIGPTIWPFIASLAAVLFVVGLLAEHWVLALGLALFVGVGVGWFRDIKMQWSPRDLAATHAGVPTEGSAPDHHQHPEEDDRT